MEGRQQEYAQHAGLSSPYTQFSPNHSEPGSSDQASVAGQYQQHVKYEPDVRPDPCNYTLSPFHLRSIIASLLANTRV